MLVLSRDRDTTIRIGPNIRIKVLAIQKQRVKLGVDAPSHVRVVREEIAADSTQSGYSSPEAAARTDQPFPVLVIEDDPAHALLISKTLEECFLSDVQVLATGEAAVRALSAGEAQGGLAPRLIFLDYHLPDRSGLEVLRTIRATPRHKTTPVVLLSAEQRESVVADCLEAGANAFVCKSIHFDDFRRSVARTATFWTSECRLPRATGFSQPA